MAKKNTNYSNTRRGALLVAQCLKQLLSQCGKRAPLYTVPGSQKETHETAHKEFKVPCKLSIVDQIVKISHYKRRQTIHRSGKILEQFRAIDHLCELRISGV